LRTRSFTRGGRSPPRHDWRCGCLGSCSRSSDRTRRAGPRSHMVSSEPESRYRATTHAHLGLRPGPLGPARHDRLVGRRCQRIGLSRQGPAAKVRIIGDKEPSDQGRLPEVLAVSCSRCDVDVHRERYGRRSAGRGIVELDTVPLTGGDDVGLRRQAKAARATDIFEERQQTPPWVGMPGTAALSRARRSPEILLDHLPGQIQAILELESG
jgi:hypothetical protein